MILRNIAVALALGLATAAHADPLMIESQGSFFIGGHDVKSDALSGLSAYDAAGTVTVDQMYVHYQVPVAPKGLPVTLIHGCCLTGKTWETTPDGRMGWDEFFVRAGFPDGLVRTIHGGGAVGNGLRCAHSPN